MHTDLEISGKYIITFHDGFRKITEGTEITFSGFGPRHLESITLINYLLYGVSSGSGQILK